MSPVSGALRCYAPSPALARYVSVLFVCTGQGAPMTGPMPAIDAQVSIRLSGDATFDFGPARIGRFVPPPTALIGPLSAAVDLAVEPGFRAVGATLTAPGWVALVGVEASRLADRVTDLADLWGATPMTALHAALVSAGSDAATVALLDAALVARLAGSGRRIDPRLAAIEAWTARSPDLSLASLLDTLSLSARQTTRLALAAYGVTPKLLAMRHRALRMATRLALDPSRVGDVTLDYADQSHMIRDFRRFLGTTPRRFVTGEVAREIFVVTEAADASLTRHAPFRDGPATGA